MRFERVWEAEAEAVSEIRHAVLAFVDEIAELTPERRADLALVVTEAATNAVLHAFPDGRRDGSIDVAAETDGRTVRVAVSDNGAGMRMRDDSPGLGLGLPLMARISDGIEISAVEGGGTRVGLQFHTAATAMPYAVYERAS